MLKSGLDEIKGIGPKTKEILLKNFESVDKIKSAAPEELQKLVGVSKASVLTEYFRKQL
jgi:excinuclease ABC subunit C